MVPNIEETALTRRRYDRIAPVYDSMEALVERILFRGWRRAFWQRVGGNKILEVGTGTGKNMPYYPHGAEIHAIDLSPRMLERAAERAEGLGRAVNLHQMDAQSMDFDDDVFDTAVATFVFCSVPDAVLGLKEFRRVVVPGGRIHLLEHMRAKLEWLGKLMDLVDPLTVRVLGPHINRRTVQNVREAGLMLSDVEELDSLGVFRRIEASVPT